MPSPISLAFSIARSLTFIPFKGPRFAQSGTPKIRMGGGLMAETNPEWMANKHRIPGAPYFTSASKWGEVSGLRSTITIGKTSDHGDYGDTVLKLSAYVEKDNVSLHLSFPRNKLGVKEPQPPNNFKPPCPLSSVRPRLCARRPLPDLGRSRRNLS